MDAHSTWLRREVAKKTSVCSGYWEQWVPGQEQGAGQAEALNSLSSSAFRARCIFRNLTTKPEPASIGSSQMGSWSFSCSVQTRRQPRVISQEVATFFSFFIFCIRVFCLHVWPCNTCVQYLRRPEEGTGSAEQQMAV